MSVLTVTQEIINGLYRKNHAEPDELLFLLNNIGLEDQKLLFELARKTSIANFGNRVFLRGLIEFSNYCRRNCSYCGIRRDNEKADRYRLTQEEILACCFEGAQLGYTTFVLQSGEDAFYTDDVMVGIIREIKSHFPDSAVTLSIGERSYESYQRLFAAGADRYLLRHEAASAALYKRLHPDMSFQNRRECLRQLKEIGYQVGAGFMVGLPGQTNEDLVADLVYLQELQPHMVGIGPFIPHPDTPLGCFSGGTVEKTLIMIALTRLLLPDVLLPSTTAMGTIDPRGREKALQAGANVVMPNLSPVTVRAKYELYKDKICTGDESAQCRSCIEQRIKSAGFEVDMARGDHRNWRRQRLMFIDHDYIESLLQIGKDFDKEEIDAILAKAKAAKGLSHLEVAKLLQVEDEHYLQQMFKIAGELKKAIYGNRIVVFAPLYISDFCVNNCTYCGYKRDNNFRRRRLTKEEIQEEVKLLEKMGHKRIALEAGEDPVNCDIDYVLDAIDTIYHTENERGNIRRINVNIAAATVKNYQKLKAKNIGTYILFQETYHQPTYDKVHPQSVKGDYEYHLTAFDRAMEAGIDDVGGGVLFGLYDYKFEVLALLLHNEHLEEKFGVGFHTISVPRLKKAEGMDLEQFPYLVDDQMFKKLVAIIRIAVPYTGIILSTRETAELRREVIKYGVSQISAGSCTGVGGYKERETGNSIEQFDIGDQRTPVEVLKSLMADGFVPSYCTACYRQGRTGDRFMQFAKSGQIQNVCGPNALMTLMEFILDYGDEEIMKKGEELIDKEAKAIAREDVRKLLLRNLDRLKNGERDLFI